MNGFFETIEVDPADIVATTYCVYDHPKDFPNDYVVRRWFVVKGREDELPEIKVFMQNENLQKIRESLQQQGLYRIPHQPGEDPVILESWM